MASLNSILDSLGAAFELDGFSASPQIDGIVAGEYSYRNNASEWAVPGQIYRTDLTICFRAFNITPHVEAWLKEHAKYLRMERDETNLFTFEIKVDHHTF